MANYTDITVLLDRSGSMQSIKSAMESGFDEFINEHKAIPTTRISLVQFDGVNPNDVIYTARPITDVPKLNLQPRGWTPLYDAACLAIDETGNRLRAMKEADRPDRVLFLIITDGEENTSKRFGQADVRDRITRQGNTYSWQFLYLGANQDALLVAKHIGIDLNRAITYGYNSSDTKNSMRGLAINTVAFASGSGVGSLDWTDTQRSEANSGGDLTITSGKS
jgi:uncharacterized protein YegL